MTRLCGRGLLLTTTIAVALALLIIYRLYGDEEIHGGINKLPTAKRYSWEQQADDADDVNELTSKTWWNGKKESSAFLHDTTINHGVDRKIEHNGELIEESNKWSEYENDGDGVPRHDDDNVVLFQGQRIVHLDLKGAAPKMTYFAWLFPLLKNLGATGLLVEYEDTFPYSGNIANISARNCYSKKEIRQIQKLAKQNDLDVIPLVQTFGHLEFVLKLEEFQDLREVGRYPQVLCPSNERSLALVYEMMDQVVKAHSQLGNLKYLHIGADEVYNIGECPKCTRVMIDNKWDEPKQLFLEHVLRLVRYLRKHYPSLKILMWDDEFRDIRLQDIVRRDLDKLVEPVVWKYTNEPAGLNLAEEMWDKYARLWPKSVWIATAFKGATGPDKHYTDISYHLENHQRWLDIIAKQRNMSFKGAILTGWQRYDHFAVLCELLPSALPSLALSLALIQQQRRGTHGRYFPQSTPIAKDVLRYLQCPNNDIAASSTTTASLLEQYSWGECAFWGSRVYGASFQLLGLEQEVEKIQQDNVFKGWLKSYNVKHGFSNPRYVERAASDLDKCQSQLMYIEKEMREVMGDIYDEFTVQEWVETFIKPLAHKLSVLYNATEALLQKRHWPRRPLSDLV